MEKDKRIIWQESLKEIHPNVIEERIEELKAEGFEIDEEVARKYSLNERR